MNYLVPTVIFFLIVVQFRCANPIAPTGGPKDTQPPQIQEESSSPNMQTGFIKSRIELTFDEWVQIKDAFNQIVVSPPLVHPYNVKAIGKKVEFNFNEEEILRENATYTINFGSAIKDLTEGNSLDQYRFVFSTGNQIDSLFLSGKVMDAVSGEPVENAFVLMHDILQDSSVRINRPFYFAKTNKSGTFRIENIKADTFRLFAMLDNNLNYLFDQVEESIAFHEEDVILNDTTNPSLTFILFKEELSLSINQQDSSTAGLMRLTFNRTPHLNEWSFKGDTSSVIIENMRDSINLWNTITSTVSVEMLLPDDTIAFSLNPPLPKGALLLKSFQKRLKPDEKLKLNFNRPIKQFKEKEALLIKDSIPDEGVLSFSLDPSFPRSITIDSKLDQESVYELNLFSGALQDIWNIENDSVTLTSAVRLLKSFGNIELELTGLDSSRQYIVILNRVNGSVLSSEVVNEVSSFTKKYRTLEPGSYIFTVIDDINDNGRWDTGNLDKRLQPEYQFTRKFENIRANWDVEAKIQFPAVR